MFEILFNSLFINFFILNIFFIINNKYFKLDKVIFGYLLLYHLLITFFYIFYFKDGAADYKTYLNLTTFRGFNFKGLVSADLITTVCAFFKNILFFDDYNIILFFSLLSLTGIIIFYKNLIKLGLEKRIAVFFLFIPGMHFWTCIPGKDSIILFLLAFFFYFYLDKKLIVSLLFVFAVFLVRPHIGFIFFTSVIITEFFLMRGTKKIFFILLLVSISLIVLNTGSVSYFFIDQKSVSDNILIQMFSHFNNFTEKFVLSDTGYKSSFFLFNIFNYLIIPTEFIFKNNSLIVNLSIMIELLVFSLFIHFILKSKKVFFDKKVFYFLLICCLFYFLIIPQALFNFGINIRQKWMILPFFIYFSFLLKYLLVKINNR